MNLQDTNDDATWAAFVQELQVHGAYGPVFSGIMVFYSHGAVAFEEGWFRDHLTVEAKRGLFQALGDQHCQRIDLDNQAFYVVENEFGNVCAVGRHRKIGLISQRALIGTVVVLFQWPYMLQTAMPTMAKFGHKMRTS
ncbi:hypothetical protein LEN26_015276 [Aphanomyces euteiches]|nr:hypothetical protein LEN26_015276 [Aphanomyces euteiches]KAH9116205.1 hypothetical protein AeMF1_009842 [Aphanomyces euteiches]KAH9194449.1 hypothetical protein AeNC1_003563 [Aphanomyces euteiches]